MDLVAATGATPVAFPMKSALLNMLLAIFRATGGLDPINGNPQHADFIGKAIGVAPVAATRSITLWGVKSRFETHDIRRP